MAGPWRACDREELERELHTGKFQRLLRGLQATEPFLRQFRTWGNVIAFAERRTSKDPLKDKVLRPIFRAHRNDQEAGWLTILLIIFWPNLESISRWKRRWDEDPEELQQNIASVFLDVVRKLNVDRRPARLAQKVVNDTIHHVYQGYKHRWSRTNRELVLDEDMIDRLSGGVDGFSFEVLYRREALEQQISRLREHRDAGRISGADYRLLVATRATGMSVADYARDMGFNYEVARKRRLRAEAAIRRFEENVT
jgi:hypothetical protein